MSYPQTVTAFLLYAATAFLSAFLLLAIEPFVGRSLLPLLGGTSAVWTTCVVFFQFVLLIAYVYVHLITRLTDRQQTIIHPLVLLLPLLSLPLSLSTDSGAPQTDSPQAWLLLVLTGAIAPTFFALATTAPLLQKWLSALAVPDPYVLYAASNLGSLIGLLAYPFLVEPNLTLAEQSHYWSIGYVVFVALIVLCWLTVRMKQTEHSLQQSKFETQDLGLSLTRQMSWIVNAAIPASLVLGLTSYVTNELAALPLFWVVPLALYLASLAIVFTRPPQIFKAVIKIGTPWLLLASFALLTSSLGMHDPGWRADCVVLALVPQLLTLFFTACMFHLRIAEDSPQPAFLTQYMLCIAFGGILGSAFNAFLAPCLLSNAADFPLVLGIALALTVSCPWLPERTSLGKKRQLIFVSAIVLILTSLSFASEPLLFAIYSFNHHPVLEVIFDMVWLYSLPLAVAIAFARSKWQLRLFLTVMTGVAIANFDRGDENVVLRRRNFYGIKTVRLNLSSLNKFVELWNGSTLHGAQNLDASMRNIPTSYYHRTGPIGQVLPMIFQNAEKAARSPYAVIGLGYGGLSAYAMTGQELTVFEIDPDIRSIADNPFYFTQLADARKRGVKIRVVMEDGRLGLKKEADKRYAVIIVDAFSSDAIPLHLLTREAVMLYFQKLQPDGILAVHISNKYYDLAPVLQKVALDQNLFAIIRYDNDFTHGVEGKQQAVWVLLSKNQSFLAGLMGSDWIGLPEDDKVKVWTDDYCNPLSVLKRKLF